MDDDIDIEEHDVFDNPAIRNIFPDLSILKKEISTYEQHGDQASTLKLEPGVLEDFVTEEKPNINLSHSISIDLTNNDEPEIISYMENNQSPLFQNKIILGSKPNQQQPVLKNDWEINKKPFLARVYINDINLYLSESKKFCYDCRILFPQEVELANHIQAYHTVNNDNIQKKIEKVKIGIKKKVFKCSKCTKIFSRMSNLTRHIRSFHSATKYRKNKILHEKQVSRKTRSTNNTSHGKSNFNSGKTCFHCKKTFMSQKLLIDHIYMVLQSSKNISKAAPTTLKRQEKSVQNNSNVRTPLVNEQVKSHKNRKQVIKITTRQKCIAQYKSGLGKLQKSSSSISNSNILLYRCSYCSYYLRNLITLKLHMRRKHKDTNIIKTKKVMFDPNCKFCNSKSINANSYNTHLHQQHKEKIEKIFKIQPRIILPKVEVILAKKHVSSKIEWTEPAKRIDVIKRKRIEPTDSVVKVEQKSIFDKSSKLNAENLNKTNNFQPEINILLLENVLFKCMRCDIHFLSAEVTERHSDHMEMLINWKCLECQKIFKKDDEDFHKLQHSFGNNFIVYELNEMQLPRILYKCSKCTIHFNRDYFRTHFEHCEQVTPESFYCKECDILVDTRLYEIHRKQHSCTNQEEEFTIVSSNPILSNGKQKSTENKRKSIKNKQKLMQDIALKQMLKLSFCDTCKCFVSHTHLRGVHMQGRCEHMTKYICKFCGLMLTSKATATHKKVHQNGVNYKLQNYTFYNLKTGRRIVPPVPEYPKCDSCDVCFLSKFAITCHVCGENEFLTCPICDCKLTEAAFKLHIAFHNYSIKGNSKTALDCTLIGENKIIQSSGSTPATKPSKKENELETILNNNLATESEILQKIDEQKSNNIFSSKTVTMENKVQEKSNNNIISKTVTLENKVQQKSVNNLTSKTVTLEKKDEHKSNNTLTTKTVILEKNTEQVPTEMQNVELPNEKSESITKKICYNNYSRYKMKSGSSDYDLLGVIYCCGTCNVAVDTYDKAVEHCQMHYGDKNLEIVYDTCEVCNMKYPRKNQDEHKRLHDSKGKELIILKFDVFFFPLDHNIWIKHIFQNFERKKRKIILERSMYKSEVKVKMHIIQEGMFNLTVYKCARCDIFVDPNSIFNHIENSCFKVRKHPCSFCGLPFISYSSRLDHEVIHKRVHNITLSSYRIVLFNEEKDKKFHKKVLSLRNTFVLHQCRNCSCIVDKLKRNSHECNKEDLKRCATCDLLLSSTSFHSHMTKHEMVTNFVQPNMRIVLFGEAKKLDDSTNSLLLSFKGKFVDYTFYKCPKCEICFQKGLKFSRHVCVPENGKFMCPKCGLCVFKSKSTQHLKLHHDSEFERENMQVIMYEKFKRDMIQNLTVPASDSQRVLKLEKSKTSTDNTTFYGTKDNTVERGTMGVPFPQANEITEVAERNAKLYKCTCGLHFLDAVEIRSHFSHCGSRISKQNCSKCSLLFTPNVLFSHLLSHHGNKKYVYKFNIIEMCKEKNEIVKLYKCPDCNLHFVSYERGVDHIKDCQKVQTTVNEACIICKIILDSDCFDVHTSKHHNSNVADVEIVNIRKEQSNDEIGSDQHFTDDFLSQVDVVRDAGFNMSNETLSQIDIRKYDNVIYKCNKCKVHFLTEHTLRRHLVDSKHQNYLVPQNSCHICGLNFSSQSLTKHIYIHHEQMKLTLTDIVIKE